MKTNERGFSIVEILMLIVIVGLIGTVGWLVYDRQNKNSLKPSIAQTDTHQKVETPKQETKKTDPYEGWGTYTNNNLSYSFKYPNNWTVTPINHGDKLGEIRVDSSDIKKEDSDSGATDIVKGSRVTLYPSVSGKYKEFIGLQKQLEDSGTIKPVDLTVGSHKSIEYSFEYEGPKTTYIRLALSDSQYIETSFMAEGEESSHVNYEVYKKVLESIK